MILPNAQAPMQNLLHLADSMSREQEHFARDLVARLFPASTLAITDREVAGVRRCLADWIFAIESALGVEIPASTMPRTEVFPISWKTLTASGLLSDSDLIQEARSRVLLWQFARPAVANRTSDARLTVPEDVTKMASMDNALLADAAMRLTSAIMRDNHATPGQMIELPTEFLHRLLWRVIAALEIIDPGCHAQLQPKVPAILAAHDEGQAHGSCAQHLAHKMMEMHIIDAEQPQIAPAKQGLALSLALLALASGLPFSALTQMAMEPGLPRLCLLMRAVGYSKHDAGAMMGWIVGRLGQENAALQILSTFESVSQRSAQSMVAQWRALTMVGQATDGRGG